MDYVSLGQRIREARRLRGLTQTKLAEMTDYSEKHIGNVEKYKTKPSMECVVRIANALEAPIEDLLFESLNSKEYLKKPEYKRLLDEYSADELDMLVKMTDRIADIVNH